MPDPLYTIEEEFEFEISAGDTGSIPFIIPPEVDVSVFTYARFQLVDKAKQVVLDKISTDSGIVYVGDTVYILVDEGDTDGFSGNYRGELHLRNAALSRKVTVGRGTIRFAKELAPDSVTP